MNQPPSLRLAAVVLKALPKAQAAKVLQRLDPPELRSLFNAVKRLGQPSYNDVESTLDALESAANELRSLETNSVRGPDVRNESAAVRPFQYLKQVPTESVLQLLADEHPRNIAIVLMGLAADQASEVLKGLEPALRVSVLKRLCDNDHADSEEVAQLNFILRSRLKKQTTDDYYDTEGLAVAVKVLSCADKNTREELLIHIGQTDAELAKKLESAVFYFDDIQGLSNRDIKIVLENIDTALWAPALRRSSLAVQTHVLRNMAETPAHYLNHEISAIDVIDEQLAKYAQQQVIKTIIRLLQNGKIKAPNPNECHNH